MRKLSAFTIVELMICLVIVIVLSGLLVPIFARVKREGKRTVAVSNLRQAGQALQMYEESNEDFPTDEAAYTAVPSGVLCDPNDDWRQNCEGRLGKPLLGSFGYVRSLQECDTKADFERCQLEYPKIALLSSIFHGDRTIAPFVGEIPPDLTKCAIDQSCLLPRRLLQLRLDLSCKMVMLPDINMAPGTTFHLFGWGEVLLLH